MGSKPEGPFLDDSVSNGFRKTFHLELITESKIHLGIE